MALQSGHVILAPGGSESPGSLAKHGQSFRSRSPPLFGFFFFKKKVVIHPHPHDDDDTLPSARVGQDQTPPVSGRSGCAAEQRFGTLKRRTETLQSFCARREGQKNKK